jgi:hypothetical protein
MADSDNVQTQSQHQEQLVTINVQSSGDPVLESRILNGKYGVGRQLGALAGVVEVLLAAHEGRPRSESAADAISKFETTQAAIRREKDVRRAARLLDTLAGAGAADPAKARKACRELRQWLDGYEQKLVSADTKTGPVETIS